MVNWIALIPRFIAGLVVWFILAWISRSVLKAIRRTMERRHDDSTVDVICRLARMGLTIVTILISMSVAFPSLSLSAMVATLGLSSIAIGFAFKDILENFLAGVFILVSRPFKIGDVIEVQGIRGTIKDIEMRSSTIELFNKEVVIMPNAILFKEPVHVAAASQNPVRRFNLVVGVDYESDLEFVEKTALEAVNAISGVADDPAPIVVFDTFADSSINFTLYWWVDTSENSIFAVQSAVVKSIQKAFAANQINIPFPIRTLLQGPSGDEDKALVE